jgi:beta-lactamase class A
VAAFIGDKRQPENPELEQQAQRIRLRRRQHQTLQKELFEQEVTRIPVQPPKLRLGRSMPRRQAHENVSRPNPEPPKPLLPRRSGTKSAFTNRSSVQPLRPISEITPQRPPTTTQGSTLPQNSPPREYRTPESGYGRDEQTPVSSSRINPWQVQPKSPSLRPPSSTVGNNTPKSLDAARNGKRRERAKSPELQRFNPLSPSSRRRSNHHPARTAAKATSSPQEGKASGKRVSVKAVPQPSPNPSRLKVKRPQKRPVHPLVYVVRLLIMGIGIGALVGTLLSALNPATHASVKGNETRQAQVQESPKPANQATPLALNQENLTLKSNLQTLVANNPKLQPGVLIVDLDTGAYIDINSSAPLSAASTIKVPILVALFQDVDRGKIRLDETLALQPEMIATGSGDLQYKKPGTKFTVLELATKMIVISDNTATNMLVARLGGAEVLTQRFHSWGLTATAVRNALPDIEGMNTSSPKELATLMALVNQGQLVSLPSRDRILNIMQNNQINTLLPQGLGSGAIIAHKTGNIGSLLADVGLVNMPSGKSYIISVMVKRPFNDQSAQELIRKISQTTYQHFNQPAANPSTSSMPTDSTASGSGAMAQGAALDAIAWDNDVR